MEQDSREIIETTRNETPKGSSWQNPGEFPEFAGKQQKTNVDRLQALLDRVGFSELKKDDEKFKNFLETTDKQDMHRYLSHINQKLREVSPKERGFHDGRMMVGELVAPNHMTQKTILDYEIEALPKIDNHRYRAASAYYAINNLHMFSDGNGRTARAIFELLDTNNSNLSEHEQFLSHTNNKDKHSTAKYGSYEFQEDKNIIDTQDYNQLVMVGYLAKESANSENGFFNELRANLEERIKNNDGNIFMIYGGLENQMPGDLDIPALNGIEGFDSLDSEERKQVCCAFQYEGTRVSISALAMLAFYQEKGEQDDFLCRIKDDCDGYTTYVIDIDPGECQNWSKEDFLHYAELAESIKEQVLETSVDIFVNPDSYKFFGKNIAEVATNAKEFYKERE